MARTMMIAGITIASLAALTMLGRKRSAGNTPFRHVRPAGTEAMRDQPEDWDIVDEQSDGSFPASDPPGNY
ncbi:MAG: hypothetical protein U1E06_12330 [Tabrizicola sp.]|uniref:hypothetical protein n=1 Tax=Tabrizicola sp. TaxID=2005166 RepID=UPI002735E8F0|nr:hypothetical protein [Tabrizicola sp.]MDP3261616.1 hypothetical protein [Tabrizicola sp.]MDP3648314.1 hypothetical protein [Paracoccaceae bacterium]MDZ4067612.1 hypothetical protein [Tabrizicola sp.]